jgi:hypothetical protein
MNPCKSARNAEIVRRVDAGEKMVDVAADYGMTLSRVSQICRRRNQWEVAVAEAGKVPQDAPPGVKPRLKKAESGLWECSDGIVARAARTKEGAYQRWLTAAIKEAQRPVTPEPAEVKPAPVKPRKEAALATPAPLRRPATPPPPVPKPEPLPDYSGPITVLPGTAQRRALSLSTTMQLNGARAAQAQPRMISIAGGSAREA